MHHKTDFLQIFYQSNANYKATEKKKEILMLTMQANWLGKVTLLVCSHKHLLNKQSKTMLSIISQLRQRKYINSKCRTKMGLLNTVLLKWQHSSPQKNNNNKMIKTYFVS